MSIEAMKLALEALEYVWGSEYTGTKALKQSKLAMDALRQAIEQAEQAQPVAWRDYVEQRLLTWRQSYVNKSGDQLALNDFMDKRSLDDLIEFVCDEYTRSPQRQPLTPEEIKQCCYDTDCQVADHPQTWKWTEGFARGIEAAHGIKP